MKKLLWFNSGLVVGLTLLSFAKASIPSHSRMTDDTAIYQRMSEIRVARDSRPNFDADIARLSNAESRYREQLPVARDPRLASPMKRISNQSYQYSGKKRLR